MSLAREGTVQVRPFLLKRALASAHPWATSSSLALPDTLRNLANLTQDPLQLVLARIRQDLAGRPYMYTFLARESIVCLRAHCAVAADVFGSGVNGSVVVVMSEVRGFATLDWVAAAGAVDVACFD